MQPTDLSQPERDRASGYASADVLEDEAEQPASTVDQVRDPMSGYMSADAMGPEEA
jgi:hypothetical protein